MTNGRIQHIHSTDNGHFIYVVKDGKRKYLIDGIDLFRWNKTFRFKWQAKLKIWLDKKIKRTMIVE